MAREVRPILWPLDAPLGQFDFHPGLLDGVGVGDADVGMVERDLADLRPGAFGFVQARREARAVSSMERFQEWGMSGGQGTRVLTSLPTPSISVTTSSPGFTLTMPSGVPVRIRSPGESVMKLLKYSISAGTSNTMSRVLPSWVRTPLTWVDSAGSWGRDVVAVHQPGAQRRAGVATLDAQVGAVPVLQVVAQA